MTFHLRYLSPDTRSSSRKFSNKGVHPIFNLTKDQKYINLMYPCGFTAELDCVKRAGCEWEVLRLRFLLTFASNLKNRVVMELSSAYLFFHKSHENSARIQKWNFSILIALFSDYTFSKTNVFIVKTP